MSSNTGATVQQQQTNRSKTNVPLCLWIKKRNCSIQMWIVALCGGNNSIWWQLHHFRKVRSKWMKMMKITTHFQNVLNDFRVYVLVISIPKWKETHLLDMMTKRFFFISKEGKKNETNHHVHSSVAIFCFAFIVDFGHKEWLHLPN